MEGDEGVSTKKKYIEACSCNFRGRRHPRRPRGSQSGREKRRDESFLVRAKEPLGTDSHRTISKNSNGCRLLIGHKKTFVLLCPISEQHLLSSFCVFVHDGSCLAIACVASVSLWFGSKERGTRVKDRATNGASQRAGRGWGREEGNACRQTPGF